MDELEITKRRLKRERVARGTAESLLDVRSRELYEANSVLQQAQNDLERRVDERTEQLAIATELLTEAAQHSDAANHAKSDFLARMSHEIRTPMNCVIGLTEVLLTTEVNEVQQDYLSTIQTSASTLLDIINDILDFSRIEAGKLTINLIEFSLREEIDRIVRPLAVRAHQKDLELIIDITADVPTTVLGDPVRINQILMNLLGNAIKFTLSGSVSLKVDMQYRMQDSAVLRFVIQDTGIGIAAEQLQTVFDAFDQGESKTTRQFGGSGLGLAISSQLIELMNGDITAKSKVGKGTEFIVTVELPVLDFYYHADSAALNAVRGLNLIFVSPNVRMRNQIAEMAVLWKCDCQCVDEIVAARLLLLEKHRREEEVRILILDTAAALEDRSALLGDLREYHPNCRLILMTSVIAAEREDCDGSNSVESLVREAAEARIRISQVSKPASAEQLLAKLHQQLGKENSLNRKDATETLFPLGLRILVVDDMPVNRKVVKAMLHDSPVVITEAENGLQALDLVSKEEFDLVLMDMRMPLMGGLEATQKIRQLSNPVAAQITIVALTANALEVEKEKCLNAGMNGFLTKPFTKLQLSEIVCKLLKGASKRSVSTTDDMRVSQPVVGQPSREINSVIADVQESNAPLFDHKFACRQVGGSLEFLKELCEISRETFTETNLRLTEAIDENQRDDISLQAHSIKGALKSLGGASVAEIAARIETDSETAPLEDIQKLHRELQAQVSAFQEEMNHFVTQSETTGR